MLNNTLKTDCFGLSDIGLVRKKNEDVWEAIPQCHFYLLADGMGGRNAGEVAAKETIQFLKEWMLQLEKAGSLYEQSIEQMSEILVDAIQRANEMIYLNSQNDENLKGMGTTICCLMFFKGKALCAHVGDSRIYRYRSSDRFLEQLTQDHSLVNELIALGQISAEESIYFPFKNILTRSIGNSEKVEVSLTISTFQTGDLFLLCSDGLTNFSSYQEIKEIFQFVDFEKLNLNEAGESLINLAKDHGGGDNVTVLIVKISNNE